MAQFFLSHKLCSTLDDDDDDDVMIMMRVDRHTGYWKLG